MDAELQMKEQTKVRKEQTIYFEVALFLSPIRFVVAFSPGGCDALNRSPRTVMRREGSFTVFQRRHVVCDFFSKFSQSLLMLPQVCQSLPTCSDLFAAIRMHLDTFRRIPMLLKVFGGFRRNVTNLNLNTSTHRRVQHVGVSRRQGVRLGVSTRIRVR